MNAGNIEHDFKGFEHKLSLKSTIPKFIRAKRYICGIRFSALHSVKIASKRFSRVFSVFADLSQRKMLRLYDGGQVSK